MSKTLAINQFMQNPSGVWVPAPLYQNFDGITAQTLSSQGAGTVNSAVQTNLVGIGVMVCVNITAVTGSLTVHIQGVDPVSGAATDLLVSAALAAVAKTFLFVCPGIATSANVAANTFLPKSWQVSSVVATGPVSAVISASVVL